MTVSLMLAAIWVLVANVLAVLPSRDNHWRRAYFLMAVGVPLLVYVVYENGLWWGLAVLIAGMSMLRWPVLRLLRWIGLGQGRVSRGARGATHANHATTTTEPSDNDSFG